MKGEGKSPMNNYVAHSEGRFVWSNQVTKIHTFQFMRVAYYTTQTGSDDVIAELEKEIAQLKWSSMMPPHDGRVTPRVFKKSSRSHKTASVDINITIDVLRHCYQKDVEAIYILTGDGDYLPLVKEAMRTGTRVFVGAFSSGLNRELTVVPDEFYSLDHSFFSS